jgi:hypothetical protein
MEATITIKPYSSPVVKNNLQFFSLLIKNIDYAVRSIKGIKMDTNL